MIGVLVIVAAFVGALVRALVTDLDASFTRQMYGTAVVNIVGSFVLGLLVDSSMETFAVVGIGGLGAMTTFSTYISQVDSLHRESKTSAAILYGLGSVVAGIAAAYLGWLI